MGVPAVAGSAGQSPVPGRILSLNRSAWCRGGKRMRGLEAAAAESASIRTLSPASERVEVKSRGLFSIGAQARGPGRSCSGQREPGPARTPEGNQQARPPQLLGDKPRTIPYAVGVFMSEAAPLGGPARPRLITDDRCRLPVPVLLQTLSLQAHWPETVEEGPSSVTPPPQPRPAHMRWGTGAPANGHFPRGCAASVVVTEDKGGEALSPNPEPCTEWPEGWRAVTLLPLSAPVPGDLGLPAWLTGWDRESKGAGVYFCLVLRVLVLKHRHGQEGISPPPPKGAGRERVPGVAGSGRARRIIETPPRALPSAASARNTSFPLDEALFVREGLCCGQTSRTQCPQTT